MASSSKSDSKIVTIGAAVAGVAAIGAVALYARHRSRKTTTAYVAGGASKESKGRDEWTLPQTAIARGTVNPIRQIVDKLKIPAGGDGKKLIPLSIGDPAVFGNLDPPQAAVDAIVNAVRSKKYNGYAPSTGWAVARQAVAQKYTTASAPLTERDVIITSGASGAIAIAIPALADAGHNILVPRPGFSLYATVCGHYGIECRYYDLLPERSWELDLLNMGKLVDANTRGIVINNPSNPCGSNYSRAHLLDIIAFAERYKLPIIADEIYADMVFEGQHFHALGPLSTEVPILTIGGIAKQYVVPGWRVGWLIIHDKRDRLHHVRESCNMLSQLILGANSIAHAALPDIFAATPKAFYDNIMATLGGNASYLVERLSKVEGLRVIVPQACMYIMIGIDTTKFKDIADDSDFAQKLLNEERVFVLPGSCFQAKNFFRIVFCAPQATLADACDRMITFCAAHRKPSSS